MIKIKKHNKTSKSGFSLIEIAIVVIIIALLITAVINAKIIIASFKCLGGNSSYSNNISLKDRVDKVSKVMDGNPADAESGIKNLNDGNGSFSSCVNAEINGSFSGSLSAMKSQSISNGIHRIQAGNDMIDAYIENNDDNAWLLVGRGRNNWNWTDAGKGTEEEVMQDLGTPAAFPPKYYSSALINNILNSAGINLTGVEIRLKRSLSVDNSQTAQEIRWRPTAQTSWTWDFASSYDVQGEVIDSNTVTCGNVKNTRDTLNECGDDNDRVFTWGKSGDQGSFRFGATTNNITSSTSNNSFVFGDGSYSIPYTEVYIRAK